MKNKSVEREKIEKAVTRWFSEKAMAEIFREKLGEIDEYSGNIHAEVIIDEAIQKAKLEETPQWSKFLFDNVKPADKKETPAVQNIFQIGASCTDETLKRLIDVTPVKKKEKNKIEDLI